MSAILLSLATFFSTLIGGLFWLRYLVYSLRLDSTGPMVALMGGFLLFHLVEKAILIHFSHEEQYAVHQHPLVGIFSAVALTGHSFLDGVGIGFQVSAAVGLIVSIAVISHDSRRWIAVLPGLLCRLPALHWGKRYPAAGTQQQEYPFYRCPHSVWSRFRLCRHTPGLSEEETAATDSFHSFLRRGQRFS
jgi:hypothetical protein